MDRDRIIGIALLLILVTAYFYFAPTVEPAPETGGTGDSTQVAQPAVQAPALAPVSSGPAVTQGVPDSLVSQQLEDKYGLFAAAVLGEQASITVETDLAIYTISNRGGRIVQTELKEFKDYAGNPLVLMSRERMQSSWTLVNDPKQTNLHELFFTLPAQDVRVTGEDTLSLEVTMPLADGQFVKQVYTFAGNTYQIGHLLQTSNLTGIGASAQRYSFINYQPRLESDVETSRTNSTVQWYTTEEDFDYLTERSTDTEVEALEESLKWLVFKQRFFHLGIISLGNPMQQVNVSQEVNEADTTTIKIVKADFELAGDQLSGEGIAFTNNFGPNDYYLTKKVAEGYNNNVDLGWFLFALFNKILVIPIFKFLEQYITNYGFIILILVFIVKLLLSPLAYKSYVSMAKQKVLKPEIDKLKEKHDGDMQAVQQEQMKLFRTAGVNPLSGCIPLVLQFPILLALFNFFPNSIELRQQAFLWAHDLSTYDTFINLPFTVPFGYGDHVSLFTLLMTGSTILYTWSNNQITTVEGPMKYMSYLMPVVFMFVLNSFAAGLTFYYFVSNLITFGQQYIIKRFIIDEEKVKSQIEKNKVKNANKKKSAFQQRLEDAMKNSQEQQAQRQKSKQNKKKKK